MQRLPEPGLIGANDLANPRDWLPSVARFEVRGEPTGLVQKFMGDVIGTNADQDFGLPVILASAMLSLLFRMSIVNPGMVSRPMPIGSPVSGSDWIFP